MLGRLLTRILDLTSTRIQERIIRKEGTRTQLINRKVTEVPAIPPGEDTERQNTRIKTEWKKSKVNHLTGRHACTFYVMLVHLHGKSCYTICR